MLDLVEQTGQGSVHSSGTMMSSNVGRQPAGIPSFATAWFLPRGASPTQSMWKEVTAANANYLIAIQRRRNRSREAFVICGMG